MRKVRKKQCIKIVALLLILTIVLPSAVPAGIRAEAKESKAAVQIIADYNSSIGSGSPYLFGGGGENSQ